MGKIARVGIGTDFPWHQEVHRDHGKLQRTASTHKHDAPIIIQMQKGLDIFLCFMVDVFKKIRAMTNFHNRHTTSLIIKQFCLGLFQYRQREHGGSCTKIKDSSHLVHLLSNEWSWHPAVLARTKLIWAA